MRSERSNRELQSIFTLVLIGALASCWLATSAHAYRRYNGGCSICHGNFSHATSPQGTTFPLDNKHVMHILSMDTDCALCHRNDDVHNPYIAESDGTPNNPGIGCTGCHGRDYGGSIGNSGVGLRAHHTGVGIGSCAGCHSSDPEPLPEHVLPTYYATADTDANDPCNFAPDYRENYTIGDTFGLDNDGDGLYDLNDPDCAVDTPATSVSMLVTFLVALPAVGALIVRRRM